jgi:hypothetical protein
MRPEGDSFNDVLAVGVLGACDSTTPAMHAAKAQAASQHHSRFRHVRSSRGTNRGGWSYR